MAGRLPISNSNFFKRRWRKCCCIDLGSGGFRSGQWNHIDSSFTTWPILRRNHIIGLISITRITAIKPMIVPASVSGTSPNLPSLWRSHVSIVGGDPNGRHARIQMWVKALTNSRTAFKIIELNDFRRILLGGIEGAIQRIRIPEVLR